MNRPGKETSPLWGHFKKVDGNFRLAKCDHCGEVVRRCEEHEGKGKALNRRMQALMKKCHPET